MVLTILFQELRLQVNNCHGLVGYQVVINCFVYVKVYIWPVLLILAKFLAAWWEVTWQWGGDPRGWCRCPAWWMCWAGSLWLPHPTWQCSYLADLPVDWGAVWLPQMCLYLLHNTGNFTLKSSSALCYHTYINIITAQWSGEEPSYPFFLFWLDLESSSATA